MYVFKVETISDEYIIKTDTLEEAKEEYDTIYNSFNWIAISPIVYKREE